MKISKGLLLFVSCLIQCISAFSQENYVPGYIVNTLGDTIQGKIDYQNWSQNPDKIYFKKGSEAVASVYTPLEVRSFGVAGEYYFSGIVQAEKSPQTTMNLSKDRSFLLKTDTTFLQALLLGGEKGLFYYTDKANRTNFYILTKTGFDLLLFKRYLIQHEGAFLKRNNNYFMGQLNDYFADCEELTKKTAEVEYNKRSLSKLFQDYFACKGQRESYRHEVPGAKLVTTVLGGISHTRLTHNFLARATGPTAGLSFNFVFPRNFGKWSMNNDIMFSRFASKDSYEEIVSGRYNRYDYEIELLSVKLSHMLRYTQPEGNTRFFSNAGFIHGYSFLSKNQFEKFSEFGPNSYSETGEAFPPNEVSLGYLVGVGGLFNRCSLEVRLENTRGLRRAFNSTSFYLLFGYSF